MNPILNKTARFLKRNSSTILTVVGVGGVVVTTVLAVKATPKAMELISNAKEEKGEELTKLEVVKAAAPVYIPAVLSGIGTIACITGANIVSRKAQASIMSAYMLVDNSYKQYKNAVKELYGEETHNKIMDHVRLEKAKDVGISASCFTSNCDLAIADECGEPVLFYDEYGNRYFETTIERVLDAEYHINRNFVLRGYTTLNELYEFLGLEETEYGDKVGWCVDDELYWIDFNHRKVTMDDGLECYIIETPWGPSTDHMDDFWG